MVTGRYSGRNLIIKRCVSDAMTLRLLRLKDGGKIREMNFNELKDKIKEYIADLPKKERDVLTMRFGLKDGHPLTLEEVGLYFNVTRERIRQIEVKALRRLRLLRPKDWTNE